MKLTIVNHLLTVSLSITDIVVEISSPERLKLVVPTEKPANHESKLGFDYETFMFLLELYSESAEKTHIAYNEFQSLASAIATRRSELWIEKIHEQPVESVCGEQRVVTHTFRSKIWEYVEKEEAAVKRDLMQLVDKQVYQVWDAEARENATRHALLLYFSEAIASMQTEPNDLYASFKYVLLLSSNNDGSGSKRAAELMETLASQLARLLRRSRRSPRDILAAIIEVSADTPRDWMIPFFQPTLSDMIATGPEGGCWHWLWTHDHLTATLSPRYFFRYLSQFPTDQLTQLPASACSQLVLGPLRERLEVEGQRGCSPDNLAPLLHMMARVCIACAVAHPSLCVESVALLSRAHWPGKGILSWFLPWFPWKQCATPDLGVIFGEFYHIFGQSLAEFAALSPDERASHRLAYALYLEQSAALCGQEHISETEGILWSDSNELSPIIAAHAKCTFPLLSFIRAVAEIAWDRSEGEKQPAQGSGPADAQRRAETHSDAPMLATIAVDEMLGLSLLALEESTVWVEASQQVSRLLKSHLSLALPAVCRALATCQSSAEPTEEETTSASSASASSSNFSALSFTTLLNKCLEMLSPQALKGWTPSITAAESLAVLLSGRSIYLQAGGSDAVESGESAVLERWTQAVLADMGRVASVHTSATSLLPETARNAARKFALRCLEEVQWERSPWSVRWKIALAVATAGTVPLRWKLQWLAKHGAIPEGAKQTQTQKQTDTDVDKHQLAQVLQFQHLLPASFLEGDVQAAFHLSFADLLLRLRECELCDRSAVDEACCGALRQLMRSADGLLVLPALLRQVLVAAHQHAQPGLALQCGLAVGMAATALTAKVAEQTGTMWLRALTQSLKIQMQLQLQLQISIPIQSASDEAMERAQRAELDGLVQAWKLFALGCILNSASNSASNSNSTSSSAVGVGGKLLAASFAEGLLGGAYYHQVPLQLPLSSCPTTGALLLPRLMEEGQWWSALILVQALLPPTLPFFPPTSALIPPDLASLLQISLLSLGQAAGTHGIGLLLLKCILTTFYSGGANGNSSSSKLQRPSSSASSSSVVVVDPVIPLHFWEVFFEGLWDSQGHHPLPSSLQQQLSGLFVEEAKRLEQSHRALYHLYYSFTTWSQAIIGGRGLWEGEGSREVFVPAIRRVLGPALRESTYSPAWSWPVGDGEGLAGPSLTTPPISAAARPQLRSLHLFPSQQQQQQQSLETAANRKGAGHSNSPTPPPPPPDLWEGYAQWMQTLLAFQPADVMALAGRLQQHGQNWMQVRKRMQAGASQSLTLHAMGHSNPLVEQEAIIACSPACRLPVTARVTCPQGRGPLNPGHYAQVDQRIQSESRQRLEEGSALAAAMGMDLGLMLTLARHQRLGGNATRAPLAEVLLGQLSLHATEKGPLLSFGALRAVCDVGLTLLLPAALQSEDLRQHRRFKLDGPLHLQAAAHLQRLLRGEAPGWTVQMLHGSDLQPQAVEVLEMLAERQEWSLPSAPHLRGSLASLLLPCSRAIAAEHPQLIAALLPGLAPSVIEAEQSEVCTALLALGEGLLAGLLDAGSMAEAIPAAVAFGHGCPTEREALDIWRNLLAVSDQQVLSLSVPHKLQLLGALGTMVQAPRHGQLSQDVLRFLRELPWDATLQEEEWKVLLQAGASFLRPTQGSWPALGVLEGVAEWFAGLLPRRLPSILLGMLQAYAAVFQDYICRSNVLTLGDLESALFEWPWQQVVVQAEDAHIIYTLRQHLFQPRSEWWIRIFLQKVTFDFERPAPTEGNVSVSGTPSPLPALHLLDGELEQSVSDHDDVALVQLSQMDLSHDDFFAQLVTLLLELEMLQTRAAPEWLLERILEPALLVKWYECMYNEKVEEVEREDALLTDESDWRGFETVLNGQALLRLMVADRLPCEPSARLLSIFSFLIEFARLVDSEAIYAGCVREARSVLFRILQAQRPEVGGTVRWMLGVREHVAILSTVLLPALERVSGEMNMSPRLPFFLECVFSLVARGDVQTTALSHAPAYLTSLTHPFPSGPLPENAPEPLVMNYAQTEQLLQTMQGFLLRYLSNLAPAAVLIHLGLLSSVISSADFFAIAVEECIRTFLNLSAMGEGQTEGLGTTPPTPAEAKYSLLERMAVALELDPHGDALSSAALRNQKFLALTLHLYKSHRQQRGTGANAIQSQVAYFFIIASAEPAATMDYNIVPLWLFGLHLMTVDGHLVFENMRVMESAQKWEDALVAIAGRPQPPKKAGGHGKYVGGSRTCSPRLLLAARAILLYYHRLIVEQGTQQPGRMDREVLDELDTLASLHGEDAFKGKEFDEFFAECDGFLSPLCTRVQFAKIILETLFPMAPYLSHFYA